MAQTLDLLAMGAAPTTATALTLTDGRVVTYGELRALVASGQQALDLPYKALVAVDEPRSLEGLGYYLAALAAGHAAFLAENADGLLWREVIGAYQPDLVAARPVGPLGTLLRQAGYTCAADTQLPVWRRGAPPASRVHGDLGMLIRTSGSAGAPKMVRLSYDNLRGNAVAIRAALALRAADRALASLPLDFSFGLSMVNSAFAAGASVALCGWSPSSELFWQYVERVRGTCVGAVPATYRFLRARRWDPGAHQSVRLLLHAGGDLDPNTVRHYAARMAGRDGGFVSMYGQTEATARITCLPGHLAMSRAGSAGEAVPGTRVTVERADGSLAAAAETGEIVVRGPGVMLGYATGRPDLADGDRQGDTLRTGDLGYLVDGLLYLAGRLDRQVKVLGRRVNLDGLEAALSARGVAAAAEVAGDERILIITEDPAATDSALPELAVLTGLPTAALSVIPVASLPRGRTGKTDRRAVRRITGTAKEA